MALARRHPALYSYPYSRQHVPSGGNRVDETLPAFHLHRTDGTATSSAELTARAKDTVELATKFDVPMQFFVDVDGAVARALDLGQVGGVPATYSASTNGDTTVPTVVITDARGTVLWVDSCGNHRIRPDPTAILEVLDGAGITSRLGKSAPSSPCACELTHANWDDERRQRTIRHSLAQRGTLNPCATS